MSLLYQKINGGHSVGQELEYVFLRDGMVPEEEELIHLPALMSQKCGLREGINQPRIYLDGRQVELCSAPCSTIAELSVQMHDLYGAMQETAQAEGFTIPKRAYAQVVVKDSIYCGNRFSANHTHVGVANWFEKRRLYAALLPFVGLFAALANNSPFAGHPDGSQRLEEGVFSSDFAHEFAKQRPLIKHPDYKTLELRVMDRAQTVDEDIAHTAFVYATAEYLKQELTRLPAWKNLSSDEITNHFIKQFYGFVPKHTYAFVCDVLRTAVDHGLPGRIEITNDKKIALKEVVEKLPFEK